ncbi:hypothetical protein [Mycobacterium sp. D16R24]|uniref:hypothetical protein n=1 Tax=Mycobacterium sp. D16R24 TaxID=1855656 RepID=UPI000992B829|nr:hypothetical protein [Mycobacterium sp. D16R24]
MAEKPLPPESSVEQQHDHQSEQQAQPQHEQSHDNSGGDSPASSGGSPAGVDPAQGLSGLDGSDPMSNMDPSTFLQPLQEMGSKVGELPQQLSQGLTSGLQPALQVMQGMASQLGQPGNGLPGAGSPGGGNKVELDPEKAHATTSKAEHEASNGLAKKSAPKGLAGKTPFDAAIVAGVAKHELIDTAVSGELGVRSVANSASRQIGTATIEAADDKAAGEQASVQGRLI